MDRAADDHGHQPARRHEHPLRHRCQVSPDYVLQYGTAILTVKPAALTIISMNQPNITYGQAVAQPTLANYSPDGITGVWLAVGWAGTDTAAALTKLPTIAPASIHVGTRSLVISGAVDPDYTIGYAYGSVTITGLPLILTADTKTKVYGAAPPTLTASAPAKGQPVPSSTTTRWPACPLSRRF